MRTPAGEECRYYYEDFNRGRQTQECRLIERDRESLPWTPDICGKCPVPSILRANGSPHLRLDLRIRKRFGLLKTLDLHARCSKHDTPIEDPMRGCQRCTEEAQASGSVSSDLS